MTMIQQEFTADGLPSMEPYLDYLLDNGATTHDKVKWGNSKRCAIIIGGNSINIRDGHDINKNL